jgi:hypothetical protein
MGHAWSTSTELEAVVFVPYCAYIFWCIGSKLMLDNERIISSTAEDPSPALTCETKSTVAHSD